MKKHAPAYTLKALSRARDLRQQPSMAEKLLWRRLRAGQLEGWRFRRQQPIGDFIVDFFCPAAALVVEIDGDTHADAMAYDASRSAWLNQRGYEVIRFTNGEVLRQFDVVLEEIRRKRCERGEAMQQKAPHPNPPPQGGREPESAQRAAPAEKKEGN